MMNPEPFFNFIQERYSIFLKKSAGEPAPWTKDDILGFYKFTNVFREDDATTVWFRENVRERLRNERDIVLATTIFRWFNRITSGEALFVAEDLFSDDQQKTAYANFLERGRAVELRDSLFKYVGKEGPFVTGAYIIKTPEGMSKLNGVLWAIENFYNDKFPLTYTFNGERVRLQVGWRDVWDLAQDPAVVLTMEEVWDWLRKFSYLGDFMAYELVTDLRFTCILERAPDIMTWANAGPGAMRGLNRLYGRDLNKGQKKQLWNQEMHALLVLSQNEENWPFTDRPLEMREIEHSLCEFDKYTRVDKGEGRPRGRYRFT